jgi:hypothetical protein
MDPITMQLLMGMTGGSKGGSMGSPLGMAGTGTLGLVQTIGGIAALNKAKKMADPSFMSAATPLLQQQGLYEQQFRTGLPQELEDITRERYRSNITELQNRFRETAKQGSSIFSRLAGMNVNEGERAIMEKDYQARMMGLQGLGSVRSSLTNIGMRDVGQAKEDKREAIRRAGAAISSGLTNLASAANYMGMTAGGGKGSSGSGSAAGSASVNPVDAGLQNRLGGSLGGALSSPSSVMLPPTLGQPSLGSADFSYPGYGQNNLLPIPKLMQYQPTSIYGI